MCVHTVWDTNSGCRFRLEIEEEPILLKATLSSACVHMQWKRNHVSCAYFYATMYNTIYLDQTHNIIIVTSFLFNLVVGPYTRIESFLATECWQSQPIEAVHGWTNSPIGYGADSLLTGSSWNGLPSRPWLPTVLTCTFFLLVRQQPVE